MHAGTFPSYGELIDLFEQLGDVPNAERVLCAELSKRYSSISVKRPGRTFDRIARIVAPARASVKGEAKLTGSPLRSYCKRVWEPRIRSASLRGN